MQHKSISSTLSPYKGFGIVYPDDTSPQKALRAYVGVHARGSQGRERTVTLPAELAYQREVEISTEAVEDTVDKGLLTIREGESGHGRY